MDGIQWHSQVWWVVIVPSLKQCDRTRANSRVGRGHRLISNYSFKDTRTKKCLPQFLVVLESENRLLPEAKHTSVFDTAHREIVVEWELLAVFCRVQVATQLSVFEIRLYLVCGYSLVVNELIRLTMIEDVNTASVSHCHSSEWMLIGRSSNPAWRTIFHTSVPVHCIQSENR